MSIMFCLGNGNSRKEFDLDELKKYGTVIGSNAIYRDFTPDILVALDSRMSHEVYRSGYCFNNVSYLGYWTPVPRFVGEEMLKTMADKTDIVWNDTEEVVWDQTVVYHGADGVFTLVKGHNLGITYITGVAKEDKVVNIEPEIDNFAYATGARAIYLACELGATEVFIIGHDLYSLDNKINNIYAGTDCYAKENANVARPDNPDETFNWIKQHKNTFKKFPNIKFWKVNMNPIGSSPIDCEVEEWKNCENLEYITSKEFNLFLDRRKEI